MRDNSRPVYSTAHGRVCPLCALPEGDCACTSKPAAPVPARIVAKLRLEKKGRGGKAVTVVYDLPRNETFLKELVSALKRACGSGGTLIDGGVEVQGDVRDRVRELLAKKGWTVKG
jgi:translation initiation factor 1